MATVLVIEDEDNLRYSLVATLRGAGHDVLEAGSIAQARAAVAKQEPDLVVSDVNLPDGGGVGFMVDMREGGFQGAIIMMTAYASIESAVDAMTRGADDYLAKPVRLDELKMLVERHLGLAVMRRQLRLRQRLDRVAVTQPKRALGESQAWKRALGLAQRLAAVPIPERPEPGAPGGANPTILVLGPTGSGKGVIAREIHDRAVELAETPDAPFVHINCTALPPQLVESELFGHEKGAFTDAKSAREGLFEMAEGGTVFLDEIGDMPLELQAKLLTVIEEGTFRRVGSSVDRRVRARLIAATNQDLEQSVNQGSFRRDLFYRLNAFTIELPALADRGEDGVLIARHQLRFFASQFGRGALMLSSEAERAIRAHAWPGNVRELINVVQRAAMLSAGPSVTPEELGLAKQPDTAEERRPGLATPIPNGKLRFDFAHRDYKAEDVEKELLTQALQHTRGNVSKAAKLIGMQRSSFRYRIERYELGDLVQELARR